VTTAGVNAKNVVSASSHHPSSGGNWDPGHSREA